MWCDHSLGTRQKKVKLTRVASSIISSIRHISYRGTMWILDCDGDVSQSEPDSSSQNFIWLKTETRLWLKPGQKYLFGRTHSDGSGRRNGQLAKLQVRTTTITTDTYLRWLQHYPQVRFTQASNYRGICCKTGRWSKYPTMVNEKPC